MGHFYAGNDKTNCGHEHGNPMTACLCAHQRNQQAGRGDHWFIYQWDEEKLENKRLRLTLKNIATFAAIRSVA